MKQFFRIICFIILWILFGFIPSDTNSEFKIPQLASDICSIDLELDNDIELIVGHHTFWGSSNTSITVLKNNGYGYFSISDTSLSFPGYQDYLICTKIDNDSFPDIVTQTMNVVSGNTQRFIRILYNDGLGSFNNFRDFSLNSGNVVSGISVGDINGDQKNDVLLIVNLQKYWGVLYNNGFGELLSPEYFNLNNYPTDIASGDLNNDGREDVVIGSVPIYIYYSHSIGFRLDSLSEDATLVKINDMNNDGKPDIIGRRFIFGTEVMIYENQGGENFILHTVGDFSFYADQLVISDLNNDSLQDIILMPDSKDGFYILYNQGSFIFSNPVFISIANNGVESRRRIRFGDFDGNGYNDIGLVKSTGGTGTPNANLILLFNDGNGNFVPDPITSIQMRRVNYNKLQNFPNPFQEETVFKFSIENNTLIELIIWDINGEVVFHSIKNYPDKSQGKIIWDGKNSNGNICHPGIYIVSLKKDYKLSSTIKIIIY